MACALTDSPVQVYSFVTHKFAPLQYILFGIALRPFILCVRQSLPHG